MSVLLNPFSRCFRTQPEPTPLDRALPLLHAAGLDTPANRDKIRNEWSLKIVETMARTLCFTQPNIDKLLLGGSDWLVARALFELAPDAWTWPFIGYISQGNLDLLFPTPESVPEACMVVHYLHEANLLLPTTDNANFDLFSLGGDVFVGIGLLASKGLLTKRNLDAVIAYPWMGTAFSDKMAKWDAAGTLTQEQLDEFLHTEDLDTALEPLVEDCCKNIGAGRGASVEHRQCALRLMRKIRILTPENRLDILGHPDRALPIALIYDWLAWGNILNTVNKDIVLNQLSINDCGLIGGSAILATSICTDPSQLATQEIFDCSVERPMIAVKVLPLFAGLVNAELFTPEISAKMFSQLGDINSFVLGVGMLVDNRSLNKNSFADLMANPRQAIETALQIICGLDRSTREQMAQEQATPELWERPGCIALKKNLLQMLQALNIAGDCNQARVTQMHPLTASQVLGGLFFLQQGLVAARRIDQSISNPTSLPTDMDASESFHQKVFDAIVANPEYALPIVQVHVVLQAKISPECHKACFTHLENLPDIIVGLETLGGNQLLNRENLMTFLSDDQAYVSKIATLLTKCRSLDQLGFERIVASVKNGEEVSAQSLDLDVGLRRRPPSKGPEMKV